MNEGTSMTTATLLASVGKQQARLVSLVYRLQDQRLRYVRLVGHYEAVRRHRNSPRAAIALPTVPLWRFTRDQTGHRVIVPLPAVRGGDDRHDDGFSSAPSTNGFSLTRWPVVGGVCMAIAGEVDLANAADLLAKLKAVAANEQHLVVDLHELHYIDTSGIKAIFDAYATFKTYKLRMSLGGPAATVKKVLDLIGAAEVVPIFDTLDAALRDLAGHM